MGHLAIAEAGKSSSLEDVAETVPGVASRHYVVSSGTFKMLTLAGGVFDVSPTALVPRPDGAGGRQRALHPHERDQLYRQMCERITRTRYFRVLFLTILGTGIRPGGAFALQWSDVPGLEDAGTEKAVMRVGSTVVKPLSGRPVFRQNERKKCRGGESALHPIAPIAPMAHGGAEGVQAGRCARVGGVAGVPVPAEANGRAHGGGPESGQGESRFGRGVGTWGNLQDTVTTHVAGETGDKRRASAQLGHSDGASVASAHYIDQAGYIHMVVDHSDELEDLAPAKVGAKLESVAWVSHSE